MTPSPRCAALALCVSAAVLALAAPAPAQRSPAVPFAFRTDAFRRLLYDLDLKPLPRFEELARNPPEDTLLVVLGRADCLNREDLRFGLKDFVEQGGAVLVATDRAPPKPAADNLEDLTGVRVDGESFIAPSDDPSICYHKKAFCPILVPATGERPDLFRRPLPVGTSGALSVAANAPSCLEVSVPGGRVRPLAWLPADAVAELNFRGRPPWPPKKGMILEDLRQKVFGGGAVGKGPLFAVGGNVGEGRVLVLADHSVFINEMMLPDDINNLEFAANCLQWLRDGNKRRTRALFVEDGTIHPDFTVPLKDGPGLPPGAIRQGMMILEETLAKLEGHGTLDAILLDRLGANRLGGIDGLVRRALEILTVVLLVYFVYRVGIRGRFRLDSAVPLLAHEVARHRPAAPLLELRYRSALAAGNLWETAHGLARQWVASLPVAGDATPPRVVVRGGWRQRFGLRRRFRRLWRLAHDTVPVRVRPRRLRGLLRDLDEVKTALAEGRLVLQ